MKPNPKRLLAVCTAALLLATGCNSNQTKTVDLRSEADLPGLRVACISGSVFDIQLSAQGNIDLHNFNTETDCIAALIGNQADVFIIDDNFIPPEECKRLGIRLALRGEESFPCGLAFLKGPSSLRDSLSHFIDSLNASGEMQALYERWFECDTPSLVPMPDLGPAPQGKPIVMGEANNLAPVAFPVEKEWHGFEPELMQRFARYAGRPVEIRYFPLSAAIPALQTGNIDLFGGSIYITEERQQTMAFTPSHFSSHTGYFVRDAANKSSLGLVDGLKQLVHNNLIKENRWRYITDGLWETVKISLLAILLGSLLGAGVCAMRMSRHRWVCTTAKAYIDLMRGIPMLVFLMIMFYVVFANTGTDATVVAVVAFALNFAAYVGEIFRTGIQSVGRGQTEAGLAIGFTRWQTFRYIVLPQAMRSAMPVYKGEAVSLVKNTSIVGYIAIHDLTRASDMIRNRTFDAFFPLLLVTVIYFLLAWLLGALLDLIVKKSSKQ